jgi:hypothetical protein
MSMKILTAVRHARHRVFSARCRASFSTFSASHFGKERLLGLWVRSSGNLFRRKQRPCLERQVRITSYRFVDVRLLLRCAHVNQIGLAVLAVY